MRVPLDDAVRQARALSERTGDSPRQDVIRLAEYVTDVGGAVHALAPVALSARRLPTARREIDAARSESDIAALRIIEAVEAVLVAAADIGGADGERLTAAADAILEACAFNDIVGQRLTKASVACDLASARLARLAEQLGVSDVEEIETANDKRDRQAMAHGPSIGGPEVTQAEVDNLFG